MLINVADPLRNLALNTCLYLILSLAIVGLIPWRALGVPIPGRFLRWLALPVFVLAVAYEWIMPSRFDIRVDLLLLLPAYGLVLVTSFVRCYAWRRSSHNKRPKN